MEEFVISDLRDSEYIFSAAILDEQGFVKISNPNNNKTKEQLSKFAEILYAADDFDESNDELEDYYKPPPKPYYGNGFKIIFDSREEKHRFMSKVGSTYLSKL